jgi:hypothetical protein
MIMMPTSEISFSHPAEILYFFSHPAEILYQDGAQSQTDHPKSIFIGRLQICSRQGQGHFGTVGGLSLGIGGGLPH